MSSETVDARLLMRRVRGEYDITLEGAVEFNYRCERVRASVMLAFNREFEPTYFLFERNGVRGLIQSQSVGLDYDGIAKALMLGNQIGTIDQRVKIEVIPEIEEFINRSRVQ
jgi:hypothetical protein